MSLTKEKQPFLVAITGNIGTGKSTLGDQFKNYAPVISCDQINKKLLETDKKCINQIIKTFGKKIALENKIDKTQLRQIIFKNPQAKKQLESIMHPVIYQKLIAWIKQNLDKNYLVIEIPLLFQSDYWQELFNFVIVLTSPKKEQILRIQKRSNLDLKMIRKILNQQTDSKTYQKKADYLIHNNQDIDYLKNEVKKIHQIIMTKCQT